jgi:hypothetical protein
VVWEECIPVSQLKVSVQVLDEEHLDMDLSVPTYLYLFLESAPGIGPGVDDEVTCVDSLGIFRALFFSVLVAREDYF